MKKIVQHLRFDEIGLRYVNILGVEYHTWPVSVRLIDLLSKHRHLDSKEWHARAMASATFSCTKTKSR